MTCSIKRHSILYNRKIALSFRSGVRRSNPKMKAEAREANNLANLTWKDFWALKVDSMVE